VNPLGVERLCVFGMPPVEFVQLAAGLDCRCIGVGLTAMRYYNPHGYSDWSLRDDPALRREMLAAMRDHDVGISLCEGFAVGGAIDVRGHAADLDIVRELGGRRINAVGVDKDFERAADGFAALAEMAGEREIEVVTEIGPAPIRDLSSALAAVRHVGRANFRLLIDTMHFFRFGGQVGELARIDPALIGYVQLCDAPLRSELPSYMEEALHERLPPGEGELPLLDCLRLVPRDVVVSVEVPRRSRAEAGAGAYERVQPVVAAARALLARAAEG
jgi:sugar phosphate isomerase/epimerase